MVFAVPGEKRAAVVAFLGRESLRAAAVGVHRVDVEIAGSHGGENNFFAVGRDGSLGIVTRILGQACSPEPSRLALKISYEG